MISAFKIISYFFLITAASRVYAEGNIQIAVIPYPAKVIAKDVTRVVVPSRLRTDVQGPTDLRVSQAIDRLISSWNQRTLISHSRADTDLDSVFLVISYRDLGASVQAVVEDESYNLKVSGNKVLLSAPFSIGILRGIETLAQLASSTSTGGIDLPHIEITDRPRFPWRGLMLDVARKFHSVDEIKRQLLAMSAVKLNVFHFHLTDREAFRVESRRFPRLHESNARGEYYTQSQLKDLVAFARGLGIRIVPEFNIPSNAESWLRAYPELKTVRGPETLPSGEWRTDLIDPTLETTYQFLSSLFAEMATIFPDEYFHIGSEENVLTVWKEAPHTVAFMKAHGMTSVQDLNLYFSKRVFDILARLGKKPAAWNQILHPGLPTDAGLVINPWNSYADLEKPLRQGLSVVRSIGYYLDNLNTAGNLHRMEVIPARIAGNAELESRFLGGETSYWTGDGKDFNTPQRVWPMAAGPAERFWSPKEITNTSNFYRRLLNLSDRLEELGMQHRSKPIETYAEIVAPENLKDFVTFASALEPIGFVGRSIFKYDGTDPIGRLKNIVPTENEANIKFSLDVHEWLTNRARVDLKKKIVTQLEAWKSAAEKLEPVFTSKGLYEESALARSISLATKWSLINVGVVDSGKATLSIVRDQNGSALEAARGARAGLRFAPIAALKSILLAMPLDDDLSQSPIRNIQR